MSKEIWAHQYPIGHENTKNEVTSWSMAQPTAHHRKYHTAPPWAASQSTSARSTLFLFIPASCRMHPMVPAVLLYKHNSECDFISMTIDIPVYAEHLKLV